jgi:hypothetical protein
MTIGWHGPKGKMGSSWTISRLDHSVLSQGNIENMSINNAMFLPHPSLLGAAFGMFTILKGVR